MKILHLSPHMGGGVGTVIMDWMGKVGGTKSGHSVVCLDYANEKSKKASSDLGFSLGYDGIKEKGKPSLDLIIEQSDVVLVHYWDHPMLVELFSKPIPDCRMAFWCHKNYDIPNKEVCYPDRFINTSPIQDKGIWSEPMEYIWSTGNMERFLKLKPIKHEGFNIGYVGTVDLKKIHPHFLTMCDAIKKSIPDARFTIVGEHERIFDKTFNFTGKVDDVAPYLAEMDVFAYSLRPDHYGTCEIALGEAMAAGVVPVVMNNPAEKQIVFHMENGLISSTEEAFLKKIKYLYDLLDNRMILSRNTRIRSRKLYSIDNMIASWNQVFESMMQNPKTRKEPI